MFHGPVMQRIFATLLLVFVSAVAWCAQPAWPSKPIRVIVPYTAGGVVEVLTRFVVTRMAEENGWTIVVDPRPGANANLAAELASRAAPDGYTWLVTSPYLINNPLLDPKVGWAGTRFEPVARLVQSPSFVLVPASLPAATLKEFVAYARANPGLNVGGGLGASTSMAVVMFESVAKLKFNVIPFNGAPPQVLGLLNGSIFMAVIPISVTLGALGGGKVKAIANTSAARSALLPGVPTAAESGYPEITVLTWIGLHMPPGARSEIIAQVAQAVDRATRKEDLRARIEKAGGEASFLGTEAFTRFLDEEGRRWRQFIGEMKR